MPSTPAPLAQHKPVASNLTTPAHFSKTNPTTFSPATPGNRLQPLRENCETKPTHLATAKLAQKTKPPRRRDPSPHHAFAERTQAPLLPPRPPIAARPRPPSPPPAPPERRDPHLRTPRKLRRHTDPPRRLQEDVRRRLAMLHIVRRHDALEVLAASPAPPASSCRSPACRRSRPPSAIGPRTARSARRPARSAAPAGSA